MKNEAIFWSALLRLFPAPEYRCTLVDDNRLNLQLVDSLSIRPLRICEPFHTLVRLCLTKHQNNKPYIKYKYSPIAGYLSSIVPRRSPAVAAAASSAAVSPREERSGCTVLQSSSTNRAADSAVSETRSSFLPRYVPVVPLCFNAYSPTMLLYIPTSKIISAVVLLGVPQLVVSDIGSGLLSLLPQLAEIISSAATSAVATLTGSVGDDDESTMRSRLRSLQVRYMAWCAHVDLT